MKIAESRDMARRLWVEEGLDVPAIARRMNRSLEGVQLLLAGAGVDTAARVTVEQARPVTPPPVPPPIATPHGPIKPCVLGWCRAYVASGVKPRYLARLFDIDADDLSFALGLGLEAAA